MTPEEMAEIITAGADFMHVHTTARPYGLNGVILDIATTAIAVEGHVHVKIENGVGPPSTQISGPHFDITTGRTDRFRDSEGDICQACIQWIGRMLNRDSSEAVGWMQWREDQRRRIAEARSASLMRDESPFESGG